MKPRRPISPEHFLRDEIRTERLQGNFRRKDSQPFDAGDAPVTTIETVLKEEASRRWFFWVIFMMQWCKCLFNCFNCGQTVWSSTASVAWKPHDVKLVLQVTHRLQLLHERATSENLLLEIIYIIAFALICIPNSTHLLLLFFSFPENANSWTCFAPSNSTPQNNVVCLHMLCTCRVN